MEPYVSANLVFGTVYSTILGILACSNGGFMEPWWLTLIIAVVPAVIAGAVTLHINRKSQLNKQANTLKNAKPATLEEVAQAYLDICGKDCGGDNSTGVPPCRFYQRPDVDENGFPCSGTCRLKSYCHKSN